MYKRLFQISLFSIFIGMSFPSIVLAIDYTTKGSKSSSQNSQREDVKKCTMSDLRDIKKFDRKAKIKIKRFREIEHMAAESKNYDEALKAKKAMEKVLIFFRSDEFRAMEIIYKKCNKQIPKLKVEPPFWVPI